MNSKMDSKIKRTSAYQLISNYYGEKRARRSQVRLMQHIDEGLVILREIGASADAQAAYCLHPLLQSDEALSENYPHISASDVPVRVVLLAMEYRNVANQYLSRRVISDVKDIRLSPLDEVNHMLIADKVQNRKDFEIYHEGHHPRSAELAAYFRNWLRRLGVGEDKYANLISGLART
jgi:hypothetical protein